MPRAVTNGAILEVTMQQRMANQVLMNVLHYKLEATASADGDDITDILDDVVFGGVGGVPDLLKDRAPTTWSYTLTRYQWIQPIRYTPTTSVDAAGAGTAGEDPLPQNVAAVITKRSLFSARYGIGAVHLGGLTVADHTGGLITAGKATQMLAIGAALTQVIDVTAVPGATQLVPVIGPKTTPPAAPRWEDFTAQTTIRVMRRRTVGLGI